MASTLPPSSGAFDETANARAPRVLCVDDDPAARRFCALTLARGGFVTDEASDGREALDKLRGRSYAAVLLDLSMPHLHGSTVLSVLEREHPALLPHVAVITAAHDAVLDGMYGRVGAVLRKPVNRDLLLEIVRKWHDAAP